MMQTQPDESKCFSSCIYRQLLMSSNDLANGDLPDYSDLISMHNDHESHSVLFSETLGKTQTITQNVITAILLW